MNFFSFLGLRVKNENLIFNSAHRRKCMSLSLSNLGTDLGLVWCRFVLGLPTDNPVISFRLANRNRTDNNFLFFLFFFPHEPSLFPHEPRFFSPRTEIFPHEPRFFPHEPRFFPHEPRFFFPTKFLEAPGRRRSLSVHYRFGQPKPINWVIVSLHYR